MFTFSRSQNCLSLLRYFKLNCWDSIRCKGIRFICRSYILFFKVKLTQMIVLIASQIFPTRITLSDIKQMFGDFFIWVRESKHLEKCYCHIFAISHIWVASDTPRINTFVSHFLLKNFFQKFLKLLSLLKYFFSFF